MFSLDPQSTAARVRATGQPPRIPSLAESLMRGMVAFTLVSLGGFAPWMFGSRWFHRATGEGGMYAACAIMFIGLSGLLLHRLIIGPGSLGRFYKLFSLAFAAYSVAWTLGWMLVGGDLGGILGLLIGAVAMGTIFCQAFGARKVAVQVIAALFIGNLLGYFIGGWAHNGLLAQKDFQLLGVVIDKPVRILLSKAVWGLCYGLGFGAGIGLAFQLCQKSVRQLLASIDST